MPDLPPRWTAQGQGAREIRRALQRGDPYGAPRGGHAHRRAGAVLRKGPHNQRPDPALQAADRRRLGPDPLALSGQPQAAREGPEQGRKQDPDAAGHHPGHRGQVLACAPAAGEELRRVG